MGFLKTYQREVLIAVALTALYFLTRLLTLTHMPIFTDEAIYLRWAQIAGNDANWRFISLTDGKQPLFIWCTIVAMRFITDPLVAGRMVSVLAGFGTMIGLFLLGREIFRNRWIGIVSAALYVVSPFALVYDRMALYDSLVGTFSVFGLYMTVLLVRTLRLDIALLMSFVAGAAVLNKTNGFFTIYLLPFALLIFDWSKKHLGQRLIRFGLLTLLVVILTYVFYSVLRLSPYFYIIEEKNAVFVYPLREWLTHPFLMLTTNTTALWDWFIRYFGVPQSLFVIGAFLVSRTYWREKLLLVLWFVLPLIGLAFMAKVMYPRYIFFMTLSLLPLVAYTVALLAAKWKKRRLYAVLIFLLAASYSIITSLLILKDPLASPIPRSDKGQYLTAWPSGGGINETVTFFEKQAEQEKIVIATGGTFGLLPYAYEIYLVEHPNVTIKAYWPIEDAPPEELMKLAETLPVYVVFYQECPSCEGVGLAPAAWPVEEVYRYKKQQEGQYLTVYRLMPQ